MSNSPFEVITTNQPKKSNKGIVIAIVIILFLVISVIAGILLVQQNQNIAEKAAVNPTNPPTTNGTYTTAQVSTHSTTADCWLIIVNKVYNISTYLVDHPGGVSVVTPYCGKEATQAFNTQGGRGSHSNTAKNKLTQYLVGTIGGAVTTPTPTPVPTPLPTPTPIIIASSGNLQCNATCTTSSQCASGRVCFISSGTTGFCRASACVNQTGCVCPATATPTATSIPAKTASPVPGSTKTPSPLPTKTPSPVPGSTTTPSPLATATTIATAGVQTTPLPIPETGTSWPTIFGAMLGILVITGSIILAF